MNKKIARVLCLILIFSLFAVFSFNVLAQSNENTDVDSGVYYCREALKSLPNSDSLLFAYDAIVYGVEASVESISVYDGEHAVTVEELDVVYDAYIRDHTEHFWLAKSYSYAYSKDKQAVLTVNHEYIMSGQELAIAKLDFNEAINAFLSNIDSSMTDYEKQLVLHDTLAAKVVYEESTHAHDAYGALVEGVAVCEGYAEALQCLLHAAGIQSLIAIGSSVNPATNLSEGHAWNIVRIDGKYYHTDLTWNDQKSNLFHAYFNLTDDAIKEDHSAFETAFGLPVCNSYDQNYFVKEGDFLTEYSSESIGQRLAEDSLLTSVYISGNVDDFVDWFNGSIEDIADGIGVERPFNYGYQILGHEVVLKIDSCLHENLTFVPEDLPNCIKGGNVAHYICECGRYFYDSAAEQGVLSPEILFFSAFGHNFLKSPESDATLRSIPEDCSSAYTYWHSCSRCGEISDTDYEVSDKHGPHMPGEPATEENPQICLVCGDILAPVIHVHRPVLVAEQTPSCTSDGKKAYYVCDCGKHFLDAEATQEIMNISNYGKLDALGHGDIGKSGKCSRCGSLLKPINTFTVSIVVGAILFVVIIRVLVAVITKTRD